MTKWFWSLDGVGVLSKAPLCLFLYIVSTILCNANKTALGEGDTLKFSQLAETLETVAEQGADAFYAGKIGQDLVKDIKEAGWDNVHVLGRLNKILNSKISCLIL